MPIIVGYALESEMEHVIFPHFRLHQDEANKYGLNKVRQQDKLYATYFPPEYYDRDKASKWDNTYILDETEVTERLQMKL